MITSLIMVLKKLVIFATLLVYLVESVPTRASENPLNVLDDLLRTFTFPQLQDSKESMVLASQDEENSDDDDDDDDDGKLGVAEMEMIMKDILASNQELTGEDLQTSYTTALAQRRRWRRFWRKVGQFFHRHGAKVIKHVFSCLGKY